MTTPWVSPVILQGKHVRLEPLNEISYSGLTEIGAGQDFWNFMLYGDMKTEDDMRNWVLDIMGRGQRGTDLPFAVIYLKSGQVAGATRYLNIVPHDRGLEVGGTWYGLDFQRTVVNTECKYLLFTHAFEVFKSIRFQDQNLIHAMSARKKPSSGSGRRRKVSFVIT